MRLVLTAILGSARHTGGQRRDAGLQILDGELGEEPKFVLVSIADKQEYTVRITALEAHLIKMLHKVCAVSAD
jgi:hypothetical protein